MVFDVADCNFANAPPLSESVVALRVTDGQLAWLFRPDRLDTACDLDFGATANAGVSSSMTARPSTLATSPTQSRVVPGTSAVIERSCAKS